MKKFIYLITTLILTSYLYGSDKSFDLLLVQDKDKLWCPVTGLSIRKNYTTSYIAKLKANGRNRQYSSLFALAKDMLEYEIDKKSIKVFDQIEQKYVDAKSAYFIIESSKKGTLSRVSKFAFSSKKEAEEFQNRYSGRLVDFNEALAVAKKTVKEDEEHFLKIKKKKQYPRGKKIFEKACRQDIDPTDYLEINELKGAILDQKLCKPLKEDDLHALALYLWEVKRFGTLENIENRVIVSEAEKCPVCGMFTYKYPRWAAQIFYKKGDKQVHYSFDGVKDLMKFYFNSKKWGNYPLAKKENITKILVTDYYSQQGIDGTKAYYVIRSDIYGPMGHEFIPFISKKDAETFLKDHFGKKILEFDEITEPQTYQLDHNE
jgi:nitrous oxide reductase accessory protein NosL